MLMISIHFMYSHKHINYGLLRLFLLFFIYIYNNETLLGIISKLYIIHGTNTINAITIGSNIVQENDINWSKRILGKEALTHINTNIIIHDFTPIVKP